MLSIALGQGSSFWRCSLALIGIILSACFLPMSVAVACADRGAFRGGSLQTG